MKYGNGAWVVGDTLVRSRYDAVTAFDARTGKGRWEYAPPGQERICTVSRRTAGSVVLIARGNMANGGCSTVAALDLTTGRERWHTPRTPGGELTETFSDMVAVGGGTAVLRDADDMWAIGEDMWTPSTRPKVSGAKALRAFDLRTGAPRWTAAVPEGCVPEQVAAGERQVVAVLACDRTELRLAAFDLADGKQRWTALLGGRVDTPALVAIADGRLYLGAESRQRKAYRDRVVAFDLASGSQVWLRDVGVAGGLRALDVTGGRVTVLADRGSRNDGLDDLRVLDAATGDEKESMDTGLDVDRAKGELPALLVYEDLVVAARQGPGVRPFSVYARE